MPKKDPNVMELGLSEEYSRPDYAVVEAADGEYTIVHNEDIILPAPGTEDIVREVHLDRLRVKAIDNAEAYIAARKEAKDSIALPAVGIIAFIAGAWAVGFVWLMHSKGAIG